MKVKTKELSDILDTLSKAIKEDITRPITSIIQLWTKEDILYIQITDIDTKVIGHIKFTGEEIKPSVIRIVDMLKLLKLTTKEEVVLTRKEDYIEVKGNGKYKINIVYDENGDEVVLNTNLPGLPAYTYIVEIDKLKDIARRNSSSLYTGIEHPELYQYYSHNGVILTSDSMTVAVTKGETFTKAIHPHMMYMLCQLPEKMMTAELTDELQIFIGDTYTLLSKPDKLEEFPISDLEPYLDIDNVLPSMVSLSKSSLVAAIKRCNVFKAKDNYSIPQINIHVEGSTITLTDVDNRSEETIGLEESIPETIDLHIGTELLNRGLKICEEDMKVHFGGNDAIGFSDDKGFIIISAVEE